MGGPVVRLAGGIGARSEARRGLAGHWTAKRAAGNEQLRTMEVSLSVTEQ